MAVALLFFSGLDRLGLHPGFDTSHGLANPAAWLLGTGHIWFVVTNLAASATATLLLAELLRWTYRGVADLPLSSALGASFAALYLGTLRMDPNGAGSWFLVVLVVAALLRADPNARRRLPALVRRRIAGALAATWIVLLAGCFVTTNLRPLSTQSNVGGGTTEGTGLVSPEIIDGTEVFEYRRGGSPQAAVRVHFVGCTAAMRGETFTLTSVPVRYRMGGDITTGHVHLAQPLRTTC
jgi:hypothetical protein